MEFENYSVDVSTTMDDYQPQAEEYFLTLSGGNYADDDLTLNKVELAKIRLTLLKVEMSEAYDMEDVIEESHERADLWNAFANNYSFIKEKITDAVGDSFNHNVIQLHSLIVNPELRGKGFGTKALEMVELFAKGKAGWVILKAFPEGFDGWIGDLTPDSKEYKTKKTVFNKAHKKVRNFYIKNHYKEPKHKDYFIKTVTPL